MPRGTNNKQTLSNSFRCAFTGFVNVVIRERNMKIHICFAVLAIILGIVLSIDIYSWLAVILCIGAVISAECMNAAIESSVDLVNDIGLLAKFAKDSAASAVLVLAIASVIVGCIVFIPRIIVVFGI